MLDPKFTDEILEAWRTDESHPYRDRTRRDLPPPHAIEEFINTMFLATLRDEEGQQVSFSVSLILPEDLASENSTKMFGLIPLASPVEFSAASLVKLAGAFDPELTTIVVQYNLNEKRFSYLGIIFHAPSLNRFSGVPVMGEGIPKQRPDYFTVIAKRRAVLTIARGMSQIGTFHAGYFVAASTTPFTSVSLGKHFKAAIQNDRLFTEHGNHYLQYVLAAMELLLAEASMRGHGGTIVLLPSYLPPSPERYETKYAVAKSFEIRKTLLKCIELEKEFPREHHFERISSLNTYLKVVSETIKRIAQLSVIDGALIVTFDFEVVAFGATLTAQPTDLSPIIGPDGNGSTQNGRFEINRYGTRHQSAFNFAAAQPDSIVFVISHDGPIRAFHRIADTTVHVWPDCTVSMFLETLL